MSLRSLSPSLQRPSAARAEPAPRVVCFSVLAEAEPSVMPRVLELFAKRNLVPRRWVSDLAGPERRDLSIDLQVEGLSPELTDYIARCVRQIWGVRTVLTSEKARGESHGSNALLA